MIKTVASVKQEIDSLKQKREKLYSEISQDVDAKIEVLKVWIKANCKHQEDNLIVTETYEEDEYGKHCPSWDEYVITCSVCGKSVTVNKDKVGKRVYNFSTIMNLPIAEQEDLK